MKLQSTPPPPRLPFSGSQAQPVYMVSVLASETASPNAARAVAINISIFCSPPDDRNTILTSSGPLSPPSAHRLCRPVSSVASAFSRFYVGVAPYVAHDRCISVGAVSEPEQHRRKDMLNTRVPSTHTLTGVRGPRRTYRSNRHHRDVHMLTIRRILGCVQEHSRRHTPLLARTVHRRKDQSTETHALVRSTTCMYSGCLSFWQAPAGTVPRISCSTAQHRGPRPPCFSCRKKSCSPCLLRRWPAMT